ncbi:uncharacterized protein LOC123914131 isoform X1 [Trifolium pratense]|uniref:uncharacterized protein LOC123914131 isoform X1 n=1 Tax=Trifolium pratense TaxID=57577 RepID=UPI001E69321A|nr:uncharacterized protein LOC123914131 isoform X1 [Trifolium pratense]
MASHSRRVPTPEDIEKYRNKFDTVIDPKLETISIPDDFYNKWKTTFDKHQFGWIRGPNYKMVAVLYEKTITGMILTNTSSVSRYFGFVKPTRVSFSYVPEKNKLWMRILQDNRSSSKRVPTAADIEKYRHKFHTVIDPNLATISIPDDFYNKWKTTFDKHQFGWIRGPNYKKVAVLYEKTKTGMILTNTSSVSRCFGFVKTTRVSFSYVPEENKLWMRILPDNGSSSKRVPTAADIEKYRNKFDTVIDPTLETISIPDEFYKKWKTSFDKHKFSWIRGPNYRNVPVFYKQTNSGMVLTDSSFLSECFGFVRPTRVTLSYVPAENKLWMRILGDNIVPEININGTTIQQPNTANANPPNLSVHHEELSMDINTNMPPTDEINHTSEIHPNINLSNKEGMLSSKRKRLNEGHVIHETCDQAHLRRSIRLMDAEKKMKIQNLTNGQPKLSSKRNKNQKKNRPLTKAFIGRIRIKKTEFGFEWTRVVTEAMARKYGTKVLHIPNEISRIVLKPNFSNILIEIQMNGVTLTTFPSKVMTAKRYQFERYISKEWARFIKRSNIEPGDKLMFKIQEPPAKLIIELIKAK